jgi:signal transduction histidine kinase
MTKSSVFLAALPFVALQAEASEAHAALPLPWRAAPPELLACLMVTLAALVLAYIGLRRGIVNEERARALQGQLAGEREARSQSDQALADNHDVLCRMVRQHEGVREAERNRIAREVQAELGHRLLALRCDLAQLRSAAQAPEVKARLERALANVDGSISALRIVACGLRGFGPGNGLRNALERCLAEHAHLYGLRYRFEGGVDPSVPGSHDRAARIAVFRVLQDVLANIARAKEAAPDAELHVRLREGSCALGLEIDGCPGATSEAAALPDELIDHIRAIGGELRVVATTEQRGCWSLSVPLRNSTQKLVEIA